MKIYIDGDFYAKEDAKISVYDHGLLYGDGVFEGIRIYNGSIFRLKEHIKRLYLSAGAILLDIGMTPDEMATAVQQTVLANEKQDGYIRLVVTRGVGNLGLNPFTCKKASVIIIVDDIQLYPEEHYENGISIITSSVRRIPPDSLDPRIKSLNYLNNILAKTEAIQAGCLEALMLNQQGYVAECTGDNIFYIKDGTLYTPASSQGALQGITRAVVIEAAEKTGIVFQEAATTTYDIYTADECFLTGTAAEMIPVVTVDGRTIGSGTPGNLTQTLKQAFFKSILAQTH